MGVDVLIDDRDARPGTKFKDSDLIGIPVRITVGRDLKEGLVEMKFRNSEERELISAVDAAEIVRDRLCHKKQGVLNKHLRLYRRQAC